MSKKADLLKEIQAGFARKKVSFKKLLKEIERAKGHKIR